MTQMKIVLAHGVLGFGVIPFGEDGIGYFKGVKKRLEEDGHKVIEPSVSPGGNVKTRAGQLAAAIKAEDFAVPGDEVCIIAHSMGGLDARYALVQDPEVASRVRTLVTIGTPHDGSPIADLFSAASIIRKILSFPPFRSEPLRMLESWFALGDLTTGGTSRPPNVGGVDYHHIAGVGRPGDRPTSIFFSKFYKYLKKKGLESDGVVPVDSAMHRTKVWMNPWPTDHADEIGWDLDNLLDKSSPRYFEHLERYRQIVQCVEGERAGKTGGCHP
jgi:triacylglycerol lipase